MKLNSILEAEHYAITSIATQWNPKTVLDMGGTGLLKYFLKGRVITNANTKDGIDGRNLPFEDKSFDVACSCSTVEHVGDYGDQRKFLEESVRVARKGIAHIFCCGKAAEEVEKWRKTKKCKHPCIVPSSEMIVEFANKHSLKLREYKSCETQLLLLTNLKAEFKNKEVYDLSLKLGTRMYSIIVYGGLK